MKTKKEYCQWHETMETPAECSMKPTVAKPQHTPTPYKLGPVTIESLTMFFASRFADKSDKDFIVRAVNCHEEMLNAMKQAVLAITNAADWHECDEETGDECKGLKCWMGEHRAAAILEEAISKADGK